MSIRDTADSLAGITPREERVLRMRFGIAPGALIPEGVKPNVQLPLAAIATLLDVTPERVRQVQSRALRKLTERAIAAAGASLTDEMQDKLTRAWRTARGR